MKTLIIKKMVASDLILDNLKQIGKVENVVKIAEINAVYVSAKIKQRDRKDAEVKVVVNYGGDNAVAAGVVAPQYSTAIKSEDPRILQDLDEMIGGKYNYIV